MAFQTSALSALCPPAPSTVDDRPEEIKAVALLGLPSLALGTAIITLAVVLGWRGRDGVKGRLMYADA